MTNATPQRGAAIKITNASKYYGPFTALDNIDLDVNPGEFISFLGPSGSGKTTTLNAIAGFTNLSEGEIHLGGQAISHVPAHKRNIGVVFQHYALFPHMTVEQNVAYPLRQRGVPRAERQVAVADALAKVELAAFADRYPSALSGGQQQRVALARAMVFSPPLLLMDEPLGALDKKLREVLQLEIKRLHREIGSTFIYVTHDQEEALVLSDRIAVFNKGKVEQIGSSEELYERPKTLFVGRFIGESSIIRGPYRIEGQRVLLNVANQEVVIDKLPQAPGPHALLIRPDKVRLARGNGVAGFNSLPAMVTEKLYLGADVRYDVILSNGSVVTSRMPARQALFEIGDVVVVEWLPADGIFLPDDSPADEEEKM
ncbi:ABC transporter ATP-binding protein [Pseudomonas taiwanensis]|uniref:Spermidine/putrescine import ATP-binding protein PotA n=1 Tax=Pseudomonas taiwanensis TaxID=470150 RepID=A0ABR6V6F4_9PSED|nr:ABC transporter ATP-binding protein [Pseudomonas taiwanensis]MBC3475825.1 ABC transporter ATP-binding protein [Pseudomonas taiwanensis]